MLMEVIKIVIFYMYVFFHEVVLQYLISLMTFTCCS